MNNLQTIANLMTVLVKSSDLFDLNEIDIQIITTYMNLSKEYRKRFRNYLEGVIDAIEDNDIQNRRYDADKRHGGIYTRIDVEKVNMRLAHWYGQGYYHSIWGSMTRTNAKDQGGENT